MAPKTSITKRRSYRYRKFKRYKKITQNYLNIKYDFMCAVTYHNDRYKFVKSGNQAWENLTLSMILQTDSETWNSYAKLFSFCKLNAVSYRLTPTTNCNIIPDAAYYCVVAFFPRPISNQDINIDYCASSNWGRIINPLQPTTCYCRLLGDVKEWKTFVPTEQKGNFWIFSTIESTAGNKFSWTLKATFYFTLKLQNI